MPLGSRLISLDRKWIPLVINNILAAMSSDDELSEFHRDPIAKAEDQSVEDAAKIDTKKKSRKLPDMWTRVISFSTDDL